ncbi:MAG: methionyl-tRNA formyltransferase [Eubacteriales bacterium]|jgi:methionyl-tRNA formyltransferase|nr:methionyl-tRNA formyltransferase [Eubacteriales bacterium]MDD3863638.1 methionyl-tRNA formyltransferase [Eubacteriales bacterium]MDD4445153.1 methionyl-tRNA formyltransferase [Eubacteriales bacterium]
MKIIYMGTPDFAVPALVAICEAGYEVALVVTKPDRPRDRGKKIQSCPVKVEALKRGLPVSTPDFLKGNAEFLSSVNEIAPDLIVVAAYGKILPVELLDIPRRGCVNIHGSILPRYRGAAPIHRAVVDGCCETGVTLMYMSEGMDAGDIIAAACTKIGTKTTAQLHRELAQLGADLLVRELPAILDGTVVRTPQDPARATYAPMISKEDARIDFSRSAEEICALVRGMYSWPCAWTCCEDAMMKVHEAAPGTLSADGEPGTILRADRNGIVVSCGDGSVVLNRIQMPGKKPMDAGAYLLGNKIEIGTVLR